MFCDFRGRRKIFQLFASLHLNWRVASLRVILHLNASVHQLECHFSWHTHNSLYSFTVIPHFAFHRFTHHMKWHHVTHHMKWHHTTWNMIWHHITPLDMTWHLATNHINSPRTTNHFTLSHLTAKHMASYHITRHITSPPPTHHGNTANHRQDTTRMTEGWLTQKIAHWLVALRTSYWQVLALASGVYSSWNFRLQLAGNYTPPSTLWGTKQHLASVETNWAPLQAPLARAIFWAASHLRVSPT